jgi:SAM-dependent methyltransferase
MAERYDPTAYGAHIADDYDAMYEHAFDTDGAVAVLADLADGGPVLEFGVGTGRLALPLAARDLEVHGVDASNEMLDKLRAKPGGEQVSTSVGDFATVRVDGSFRLVVLAINTVFALPDQDAQVAVFENAARHLRTKGRFVVEAWVPDLGRFHRCAGVWPRHLSGGEASIEIANVDPIAQRMETVQVRFGPDRTGVYPANHRYAWPAELDLMARLANMRLEHRWEDWQRRPMTRTSTAHVSVYRLDA